MADAHVGPFRDVVKNEGETLLLICGHRVLAGGEPQGRASRPGQRQCVECADEARFGRTIPNAGKEK